MFDVSSLKYDRDGLIAVIAQDAETRDVLMMAYMNAQSLRLTLETGQMTYWSRSRQNLWAKGATSGHVQRLVELRIDCDRDCLLALVDQVGAACHTNRRSCFYTALRDDREVLILDVLPEDGGAGGSSTPSGTAR